MNTTKLRFTYSFIIGLLLFFTFWGQAQFLVTLSAIFVALFKDKFTVFYFPPDLKLIINESTECLHEVTVVNPNTNQIVGKEAWLGVIVRNEGAGFAEGVEVYIDGLNSNAIQGFGNYKTIPLVRSWSRDKVILKLPPKVGFRYDLCFLRPSEPQKLNFALSYTPTALLNIDCSPGTETFFEFEIKAFANNGSVAQTKAKIVTKGNYLTDFKILLQ